MPTLSVIIPVFNEAERLRDFMDQLASAPCPVERELIFVDDGSQDRSYDLLSEFAAEFTDRYRLRVIRLGVNRGKGAAVRQGFRKATGDLVMIQDADFENDPRDVPALLKPLLDDEADVVYGSRFQNGPPALESLHAHLVYAANRFLTWMSNRCSGMKLTDMETCYKVFRADLVQSMNLTSERFGIEAELTACVAKTCARVCEVPISYRPRTHRQGKKITWKDGLAAIFHIIHYNRRSLDRSFENLPEKYHPGQLPACDR